MDIANGASFNRVGGSEPWQRNIISGNSGSGVAIDSYIGYTMGNEVIGDFIGTDVSGTSDLGNGWTGVNLVLGALNNTVKDNLVSGSNWGGIAGDVGVSYKTIIGNLVGTDATGTRALGNRWAGIAVGECFNRTGGTSPGDKNVISGNPQGIAVGGSWNFVMGNFVGTNLNGTEAISNAVGIFSCCASSRNSIGGVTLGERNLVSGSRTGGIVLGGVERAFVLGNYIGTDADGLSPLPNGQAGISVEATNHTVIQGNLISGNEQAAVSLDAGSRFSLLRANRIGAAAEGLSPLPNGQSGVTIEGAENAVGGSHPEDGNVIAHNNGDGVTVWTNPGNTISHNAIHSNVGSGIYLGNGGNNSLPAPEITDVTETGVSGTACTHCIVELFSDQEDEGRLYQGTTLADGSGNWTWTGGLNGPYVTATATDEAGNTSAFSAPQGLWEYLVYVYLPLVVRR